MSRSKTTKLPRESFYYVRVGSMYFTGTEVIMREVEVKTRPVSFWDRLRRPAPGAKYINSKEMEGYLGKGNRKARWGTPYPEPVMRKEPTGEYKLNWTEDFTKVKKFRRREQADDVVKTMRRLLPDAKPIVKLYEGVLT